MATDCEESQRKSKQFVSISFISVMLRPEDPLSDGSQL